MPKTVDVRFDGNIALVELKNGKNEFTHEFLDDLNEALDTVLNNPSAEALVVYGTGKHFSNGLNLPVLDTYSRDESFRFGAKFCNLMVRLTLFPVPTIAAVNGHAFAGGGILFLCFDHRVMNKDRGWFCLSEVHLKRYFSRALMAILTEKIPNGNAQRDVIVMGKRLTGPIAHQVGIVDRLVPYEQILDSAVDLARDLIKQNGAYSRTTLRDMKRDVYASVVDAVRENEFYFLTRRSLPNDMPKCRF